MITLTVGRRATGRLGATRRGISVRANGRPRALLDGRTTARTPFSGQDMSRPGPIDRVRQTQRLLRSEGSAGIAARLADRVSNRLAPRAAPACRCRTRSWCGRARSPPAAGRCRRRCRCDPVSPLTVAWVCVATGGRAPAVTRRCSAWSRRSSRPATPACSTSPTATAGRSSSTARRSGPGARRCGPTSATPRPGIEDAHAIFATGWSTAYTVLASPARGTRFYLVQDFEPSFYPAGSESLLAEATYRFGFHGVTAGAWLAELLRASTGCRPTTSTSAATLDRYGLDRALERDGICYYARSTKPRRAFELGLVALELFAERHPEVADPPLRRPRSARRSRRSTTAR